MAKGNRRHEPKHSRVSILSQAFTLWLMDMHSLPLTYTQTPEFREAYKHYYMLFITQIHKEIITTGTNNRSMGDRRRDDNGKVTPYPTSSSLSSRDEDEGEGITLEVSMV